MIWFLLCFLMGFAEQSHSDISPVIVLSLKEAERAALTSSNQVQATFSERDAQAQRVNAQFATLWPRLNFEAHYRYQSVVPYISQPAGFQIPLGNHNSYSVGPTLNWTILDFGASKQSWNSSKSLLRAREFEAANSQKQLIFEVRSAYFRTALFLEQMKLVRDSLKLAEAQYSDIRNRRKVGAASQIDALSFHKEVLSMQRELRQARAELVQAMKDLLSLISRPEMDSSISWTSETIPNQYIKLDSIAELAAKLKEPALKIENHPRIQALALQAEAQHKAAEGIRSGVLPRIQLNAKASLEYPNGPILERVQQNTLGVSLSFPLFEFSRTRAEAAEKNLLAQAAEFRKAQAESNLLRDYSKAKELLNSLRDQREILAITQQETTELSGLVYESYKAGRSGYLDVQSANLRALDARVQTARNEVQILVQLAILESLTNEN